MTGHSRDTMEEALDTSQGSLLVGAPGDIQTLTQSFRYRAPQPSGSWKNRSSRWINELSNKGLRTRVLYPELHLGQYHLVLILPLPQVPRGALDLSKRLLRRFCFKIHCRISFIPLLFIKSIKAINIVLNPVWQPSSNTETSSYPGSASCYTVCHKEMVSREWGDGLIVKMLAIQKKKKNDFSSDPSTMKRSQALSPISVSLAPFTLAKTDIPRAQCLASLASQ